MGVFLWSMSRESQPEFLEKKGIPRDNIFLPRLSGPIRIPLE